LEHLGQDCHSDVDAVGSVGDGEQPRQASGSLVVVDQVRLDVDLEETRVQFIEPLRQPVVGVQGQVADVEQDGCEQVSILERRLPSRPVVDVVGGIGVAAVLSLLR
jgi:hypothetical protein